MTLPNPFPIQKASITYGSDPVYGLLSELFSFQGGVAASAHLKVSQHGTPNLGVDVAIGTCYVPSTQANDLRRVTLTSVSNTLTTPTDWANGYTAADATNPRVDAIVVQLNDSNIDASGLWNAQLKVLTGTATAGATLVNLTGKPALAANQILLAYTLLPALATTITTANILDQRSRVSIGNVAAGYGVGAYEPYITAASNVLPASPLNGDTVVLQVDNVNKVDWTLRYNGGATADTAFPWEFIGGPPIVVEVATSETTASTTYADLATVGPSITVPRSGLYVIQHAVQTSNSGANNDFATPTTASLAANDQNSVRADGTNTSSAATISKPLQLAAGETLKLQYRTTAGTATFLRRRIALIPVRVI